MRIAIINGEPDASSAFNEYQRVYAKRLADAGNEVTALDLRDLDLKGCSGCWGCWVKTPGECVKQDGSAVVCRTVLAADLVVWASPVRMGFTSALTKRAQDQLIPLVHPYVLVEGGEMHHRARYERYPRFGLLLAAGPDTDSEDIEITRHMWSRTARNIKTDLAFTAVTTTPAEEAADELASVA
jgi:multimeric flavodoxin WrbA